MKKYLLYKIMTKNFVIYEYEKLFIIQYYLEVFVIYNNEKNVI